jgi:hypothetical protein
LPSDADKFELLFEDGWAACASESAVVLVEDWLQQQLYAGENGVLYVREPHAKPQPKWYCLTDKLR